jgi:hypothetical protein
MFLTNETFLLVLGLAVLTVAGMTVKLVIDVAGGKAN